MSAIDIHSMNDLVAGRRKIMLTHDEDDDKNDMSKESFFPFLLRATGSRRPFDDLHQSCKNGLYFLTELSFLLATVDRINIIAYQSKMRNIQRGN